MRWLNVHCLHPAACTERVRTVLNGSPYNQCLKTWTNCATNLCRILHFHQSSHSQFKLLNKVFLLLCWWWCLKIVFASGGGRKHFLQHLEFICFSNKLAYFSLVKCIDCRTSYIFPDKSVHESTYNSLKLWNYNPISFQAKTKQNKTKKKYYTVGRSSLTQKESRRRVFFLIQRCHCRIWL